MLLLGGFIAAIFLCRITLPLPWDIDCSCPLLCKPSITLQKKKTENEEDCEVQPYNYNNPNDSNYCSQNGVYYKKKLFVFLVSNIVYCRMM